MIPTTTTKDQAIDIPPGISKDDWNKMTLEEQYDEQCYNYFDNIDADDDKVIEIPHDIFDMFEFDPTTETTPTATTTGQNPHENPPDAADTPIHTDTTIQ